MSKLKVSLLTGRTIDQGKGKEFGKLSEEYWKSVAICEMDPNDIKELGIRENDTIKITTDSGSAVVRVVKSKRTPHPKVVFIPYGPWASLIVDPKTHGTGMPSLKGIEAWVEPTGERVLGLPELLRKHYKKG